MKIHTVWGLRKGEDTPELMVAWDEFSVENHPEGFDEAVEREVFSWGNDLLMTRSITVNIPSDAIFDAFAQDEVEGTVE